MEAEINHENYANTLEEALVKVEEDKANDVNLRVGHKTKIL